MQFTKSFALFKIQIVATMKSCSYYLSAFLVKIHSLADINITTCSIRAKLEKTTFKSLNLLESWITQYRKTIELWRASGNQD